MSNFIKKKPLKSILFIVGVLVVADICGFDVQCLLSNLTAVSSLLGFNI